MLCASAYVGQRLGPYTRCSRGSRSSTQQLGPRHSALHLRRSPQEMNRRLDEEGKARAEAEIVAGEKLLEIDRLKCVRSTKSLPLFL